VPRAYAHCAYVAGEACGQSPSMGGHRRPARRRYNFSASNGCRGQRELLLWGFPVGHDVHARVRTRFCEVGRRSYVSAALCGWLATPRPLRND